MNIKSVFDSGREFLMKAGGIATTVNIKTASFNNSDYDDETVYSAAGSEVVSGLLFPMGSKHGSEEAMLLEQGKLLTKDKILYTGDVSTSSFMVIEVQGDEYTVLPDGVRTWQVGGSTIYNKFFIRHTVPGSLFT